jgi:small ligand-binding sensory domain FIST
MQHTSAARSLGCASSLSGHVDPVMAAEQVCEDVSQVLLEGPPDLCVLFVSGDHVRKMGVIAETIRSMLEPGLLVGVSGEGVIGQSSVIDRNAGVSLFAAHLPGTTLHPFTYQQLPHAEDTNPGSLAAMAEALHAGPDLRGVLFFADPFSVPAASAVAAMSAIPPVVEGMRECPIIGGMASASIAPGNNLLVLGDEVLRSGGVGVSIRGNVALDTIVSQGCRPIGQPLVVTAGRHNVLRELGGKRALDAVRETVESLPEEERQLVTNGVFIGRVVNEYKDRFGRGDFLIRGLMGVDTESGVVMVGDSIRVGQTVQLHVSDAQTAAEDLELLLAAQQLRHPASGGLLFTCNDRIKHDDAKIVRDALGTSERPLPLAGFFAAGEIGPIGDRSYIHGHTACLTLLRQHRPRVDED